MWGNLRKGRIAPSRYRRFDVRPRYPFRLCRGDSHRSLRLRNTSRLRSLSSLNLLRPWCGPHRNGLGRWSVELAGWVAFPQFLHDIFVLENIIVDLGIGTDALLEYIELLTRLLRVGLC
jgi:hypothetical protein